MSSPAEQQRTLVNGLQLVQQLEATGAISDSGLSVSAGDLTVEQCEALASMLGRVKRLTSWALGDLIVYCEAAFGEDVTYGDIAEATGLSYYTVTNLASISRRVPPSRRIPGLPHSMHETVAALPPREQKELLTRAMKEGWTRAQLREVKEERARSSDGAPKKIAATPSTTTPDVPALVRAARDLLAHADVAGENAVCRLRDLEMMKVALREEQ